MRFRTCLILSPLFLLTFIVQAQVRVVTDSMGVPHAPAYEPVTSLKKPVAGSALPQEKAGKSADEDFFEQLAKLPEFISERRRIDSLRKVKRTHIKLHVDYNENPFRANTADNSLSMTILYEKPPEGEMKKLYTIMFHKEKRRIISVEDHIKHTVRGETLPMKWKYLD